MTIPGIYTTPVARYLERAGLSAMRPKAALVDMDGTLYDSMVNHTAAWHRLISGTGIPCTREEFYLYEGCTGAATIDALFVRGLGRHATDREKEELYRLKTVYFQELPPVDVMEGAPAVMDAFRTFGLKRVLVTGSGQNSLINRLDADYPGIFSPEMRITSRSVSRGKPDPEPYLKAMELAGVTPSESIVLENAPLGVEAGRRSGAFTIAVTTGPVPAGEMWDAGADIVFPSMPDLAANITLLLTTILQTKL